MANMNRRQLDEDIRLATVDVEGAEQAARDAARVLQFCENCVRLARRDLDDLVRQRNGTSHLPVRPMPRNEAQPRGRQVSRSPRRELRRTPGVPEPTHPLIIEVIREIQTMPNPHVEGAWLSHLNTGCNAEILAEYRKTGSGSMTRLGKAIREVPGYDMWLQFGTDHCEGSLNDVPIIALKAADAD